MTAARASGFQSGSRIKAPAMQALRLQIERVAPTDAWVLIRGEHGTGKRKRLDFLRCYGLEAVEQLRRCKAAVDPELLLNRGNVVEYAN